MSALGEALRLVLLAIRHPATQRVLNHVLREATAEVVRHIQSKTRGRTTKIHYS